MDYLLLLPEHPKMKIPWDILYKQKRSGKWLWLTSGSGKTPEEALQNVKKHWWPRQDAEKQAELQGTKIRASYPDMPNRKVAVLGEASDMKITKSQLTEMIREAVREQINESLRSDKKQAIELHREIIELINQLSDLVIQMADATGGEDIFLYYESLEEILEKMDYSLPKKWK